MPTECVSRKLFISLDYFNRKSIDFYFTRKHDAIDKKVLGGNRTTPYRMAIETAWPCSKN